MENGLKQERSTGFSLPITVVNENELAQQNSSQEEKRSPALTTAHTKGEFSISTGEVLDSKILAILMLMGDFKELKNQLPDSRQKSANGKIYWSAEMPGHTLEIVSGKLLVDGKAFNPFEKILEEMESAKKKNTGGKNTGDEEPEIE
jgi:hypothetical protein